MYRHQISIITTIMCYIFVYNDIW